MRPIVVLGGAGMLGHKIFQVLRERFPQVFCTIKNHIHDRMFDKIALFHDGGVLENFDAIDFSSIEQTLAEIRPDYIINCIGIVKQRSEAHDYILSITLNSLLPHKLAQICKIWGGRLIHFSTDCVFSGRRGSYREDDPSDAEDLYGKTKYLGEVTTENSLTLRTSIIGRELYHFQSLLEWLLNQNHRQVHGFKKAFYSGVTTNYMAKLVGDVIENYPELTGLYQVTGNTITKYDLLCLLRDAYQLDIEVLPEEDYFCDRTMLGDKFHKATGYVTAPWPELVAQLAADPTPYDEWR